VLPAFTTAVSVITLPAGTVVADAPPEVTAIVVLVAVFVCADAIFHAPETMVATDRNATIGTRELRGRTEAS
jgi:hypothetical protein